MSLIALPASLKPQNFQLELKTVQRLYGGPFGGQADQATYLRNDRWSCAFTLPGFTSDEGAVREAFIASMRGMTNWVPLHHFGRPTPRGTIAGTPTLSVAASAGAALLILQTSAGATMLAGDMFGIDGLLFMTASDCQADVGGVIQVPIVNRLRRALSPVLSVTLNKPTALFRLASTSGVSYVPGKVVGDTTLEFVEKP